MAANPADPVIFSRLTGDNSCELGIGQRRITLKHRPTVEWLAALADQDLHLIMPGMLRQRDTRWYVGLLADPTCNLDVKDMHRITHAVVREVTGVPWWTAVRLANALGRSWFLAEPAARCRGVDLLALPVRSALAVAYLFATETCETERDRAILDSDLFRPPEGVEESWSPQQQAESFSAFRATNSMFMRPGVPTGTPG